MAPLAARRSPKPRFARPRPRCRRPRSGSAPACGYGACSVSGCPCKAYQSSYGTELCGNCGHSYTAHW
jgi:hypothetical protein